MQKCKRKKRLRPAFKLVIAGFALLALVLVCLPKGTKPQELPAPTASLASRPEAITIAAASSEPTPYTPDEADVKMLAQMLWGEARGIPSDMEKAACVWCVLNRVDDESGLWSNSIAGVLEQKNQFAGYSSSHPAPDDLKALAVDVLVRWQREKVENGDVGRVLPADYFFFTGDGRNNHFRAEYQSTELWDWSLPSPYEN